MGLRFGCKTLIKIYIFFVLRKKCIIYSTTTLVIMIQRKNGNERKKPREPAGTTRYIYFSKSIGLVSRDRGSRQSPTTCLFQDSSHPDDYFQSRPVCYQNRAIRESIYPILCNWQRSLIQKQSKSVKVC